MTSARSEARGSGRAPAGGEWAAFARGRLFARPQSGPAIEALRYRERPFASLLAPPPAMLGTLALDGEAPTVEAGETPLQP